MSCFGSTQGLASLLYIFVESRKRCKILTPTPTWKRRISTCNRWGDEVINSCKILHFFVDIFMSLAQTSGPHFRSFLEYLECNAGMKNLGSFLEIISESIEARNYGVVTLQEYSLLKIKSSLSHPLN